MANTGIAAYTHASNRNASIERYGYLVKRIAHHLMARLPETVQVDDLVQAGMVGLIEALAKYDASKGASFETYAGIRIRGAMLDEMRRGDWAPRSVHRNSRRVTQAMQRVEHERGQTASDKEIAEVMGVSLEEYYKILRDAASCRLFSFEQVNESDDTSILPSIDYNDHGIEQTQLLEDLSDAMGSLPEREQLVMSLYYDEELNLKEIGAILEVSESRVSQILSQATHRVRSRVSDWMEEA
jgi:RNA polymerase sigma factor for flagellar operon FliA